MLASFSYLSAESNSTQNIATISVDLLLRVDCLMIEISENKTRYLRSAVLISSAILQQISQESIQVEVASLSRCGTVHQIHILILRS